MRPLHPNRPIRWSCLMALSVLCPPVASAAAMAGCSVQVTDPRCEYLKDPLGIDARGPRLSWRLSAVDPDRRGQRQTAYRVLVASTKARLDEDQGDL